MIDFKEIPSSDDWELFARDFFSQLGFVIESDPSRGPDGGKDLIISEQISGVLHTQKFTWLVSCKHFATSGKSVGVEDESNITERLRQHKCDGFIGFYSTISSTALSTRLEALKQNGDVTDFCIYDHQKIAGYFYEVGLSRLANRYFPMSYAKIRPLQQIVDKHIELKCEICDCDWIKKIMVQPNMGIVVYADKGFGTPDRITDDIFICCKGDCDDQLKNRLHAQGYFDTWQDIEDLCKPLFFLKDILTYMNILHAGDKKFSYTAHDKMKTIYIAASQRVLREITEEDRKNFNRSLAFEGL